MGWFKRKKNDDDIAGNKNASFIHGEKAGKSKGRDLGDESKEVHWFKWWLGYLSGFDEDKNDDWKGWE